MLFRYQAFAQNGERQTGTVEAGSVNQAVMSLQNKDLFVYSVAPDDWRDRVSSGVPFISAVSSWEVMLISKQLAVLFEAQVSALRVFRVLAEEVENPALRKVLNQVGDDIQDGWRLSAAMAKHPKIFSEFYINMIRAGEESGLLDSVLRYLSEYMERNYILTSEAKRSLAYPLLIVVVSMIVMAIIFVVLNNYIVDIVFQADQELPIYTELILNFSAFLGRYWWVLLSGLIIGLLVFFKRLQTERGRRQFDRFKLELPIFGRLYQYLYISRIADTLYTMISSGVPMVQSLEVASRVVGNRIYRDLLEESVVAIKNGQRLSKTFERYSEIPGAMIQITRVGEETGSLAYVLGTLAKFYQREFRRSLETAIGLIEPALIIFLGIWVGIIMASVLIPIYNFTASAGL